jgi:BioD-like phosphotransacetylase family protein
LKEKIENSAPIEYSDVIKGALARISKDKDIVLIESARNITYGSFAGISSKDICSAAGAKAILIMKYEDDVIDKAIYFKNYFKEMFGGIIINKVAVNDKDRINKLIMPYFKKIDIDTFGVLYSDSVLSSISIKDMVKHLEGEILCAEGNVDTLVESFMVGAMGHEMALKFFRTKTDKVVITGGDRADVQLAALETKTKCLVLTGLLQPNPAVISRAEELGVPMVLVRFDTLTTISKINEILGQSNLHELKKLNKLIESVKKYIDLDRIIELAKA